MIGIYAKNSAEWITVDLACLNSDITSVTLYDTLGVEATDYILNQCELKTVFCTSDKISQLAKSKLDGKVSTLLNLVLLDSGTIIEIEEGTNAGLKVY